MHIAVEEIQKNYPIYSVDEYKKKIRLIAFCYWVLTHPTSVSVVTRVLKWLDIDLEEK